MNQSGEVDILQAAWRETTPEMPAQLQQRVHRQTSLLRVYVAIDLVIAIAFLGTTLWKAISDPTPEYIVLAIVVWMITLTTLIYALQNRAATWRPSTHTTREYLDISLRRCHAGLRATTFGFYLVAVEVLFLAWWHAWYWSRHSPVPPLRVWLIALCLPAAVIAGLLFLRGKRKRELARLENMRRELFS